MFHKLLKSIVNDINMLYAFDALELRADDYKMFMEAIDKKLIA